MLITARELLHIPVYTKSGQFLGRVVDFEIELDSQTISKYQVKTGGLVSGLFGKLLLIDRQQVIAITREKMIVKNGTVPDCVRDIEEAKLRMPASAGISSEMIDTK